MDIASKVQSFSCLGLYVSTLSLLVGTQYHAYPWFPQLSTLFENFSGVPGECRAVPLSLVARLFFPGVLQSVVYFTSSQVCSELAFTKTQSYLTTQTIYCFQEFIAVPALIL